MSYQPEVPYKHGNAARVGVLLVNLGTPDAPTPAALRRYLAEFLSDPRVVEIPKLLWWMILHGVILRVRPAKSALKYAAIWMPEGSPLAVWTAKQAKLLLGYLGQAGHTVLVRHAMRYGQPGIAAEMDALRAEGAQRASRRGIDHRRRARAAARLQRPRRRRAAAAGLPAASMVVRSGTVAPASTAKSGCIGAIVVAIALAAAFGAAWVFVEVAMPLAFFLMYWLFMRAISSVANDRHGCAGDLGKALGWGALWATIYVLPIAALTWALHALHRL